MKNGTRAREQPIPNHERVIGLLQKSPKPMTAYELLDRLRPQGITAPPTIYRALDRLIGQGRAHRLESLNAFVACAHPHHGASAMFSICGSCGTVAEFSDPALDRRIAAWARRRSFEVEHAVLEVRGRCDDCSAAHPKAVSTGA
jgi:Fur family zinc uptake transcriptional regulator